MKVLFLGAPGSGKGTQAERLSREEGIPSLAMGDILRDHVKQGTEPGNRAREYMDRGELVPDPVVLDMIGTQLSHENCGQGFILDGFPRNVSQAKELDRLLSNSNQELDYVIYLDVPEEEIVSRLSRRRICPSCRAIYHLDHKAPTVEGACDVCHTPLIQRDDDREDTIRNRMKVYRENTEPLVNYYREKSTLRHIIGLGSPDDIFNQIISILGSGT